MKSQTNAVIQAIFKRRSIGRLKKPGPSEAELITILRSGAAAPDHKLTRPFWFVVFEGRAREEFGTVMVESLMKRAAAENFTPTQGQIDKERSKFLRAPLVISVVAIRHRDIRVPDQEIISAGAAAAQNMLIAATSLGFGSIWRTGSAAYDTEVKLALGVREDDFVIGFLYFGSLDDGFELQPNDPELSAIVSVWEG